jgi:undecaprenyl diphosphate synthase
MIEKDNLDLKRVPSHVAIIMDGNGRWAKARGEHRVVGHQHGVMAVKRTVKSCVELGIKYLTLYAFSTENWNRPKEEVDALMELMVEAIVSEVDSLHEQNIRLMAIGDLEKLPEKVKNMLNEAMDKTAGNTKLNLVLALSYSSRWEIINAVKLLNKEIQDGNLNVDDINEEMFSSYLTTKGMPEPELLIRTSGESRLSNFLLWQLAYTEFYFIEKFWPDFQKEDLYLAIYNFQQRERRFGKTSEQLKK